MEWTDTARRTLDEYCDRARAALAGTGADADEVIDDLRRHVEEEARTAHLSVVTEGDVRRILARVGEPGAAIEKEVSTQRAPASDSPRDEKKRPGFILLILGVFLPLGTFIFELVTGASAGILFDPLPGWFQIVAVALVPAVNSWTWWAGRSRDARSAKLLGWLNGVAIGVCLYYSILYLPFTPFAVIGIIYVGLGLVPLTPLIALIATPLLRGTYARRIAREKLSGALPGVCIGFGVLALLQVPTVLTYHGFSLEASGDRKDKGSGVRLVRTFGDRELLLRACYGMLSREIDVDFVRAIAGGRGNISPEEAREMYYRVTGQPFNSVPPPALYTRSGMWTAPERDFAWDGGLGGEEVAGRVKGLSLLSSRMDAVAEPDAALVYCEWTLEFKNVSGEQREARAQIALPPGAVVSRLTLWINGEEREAAFGGRSQVKEAYKEVAVVRRRDPVLVTTCGPDRVLVQCFPVPPTGGVMKVRMGLTAPLMLASLEQGKFIWPRFLERNFAIPADFKHSLWIESPAPLSGGNGAILTAKSNSHPFLLRETVPDTAAGDSATAILVHRSSEMNSVWTPSDESSSIIRQTIRPAPAAVPSRIVLVLDGSIGMEKVLPEIADGLSFITEASELAVIVAGDDVKLLNAKPEKATAAAIDELKKRLRSVTCEGGQDNLPALEQAWDLAAAVERGVVVWIHQPQPVLLSSESTLRQAIERNVTGTRLFEIQIRNGPDRIVEKLDGLAAIDHLPPSGSVRANLSGLLDQWSGKSRRFELVRERVPASLESTNALRASKQLERLWARDETLRLAKAHQRDAATKLAAANQLVTPLTGAVVLETQQQFTQHGLSPADPASVPAVPEPGAFSLLGVGILAVLWFRKRRRDRG